MTLPRASDVSSPLRRVIPLASSHRCGNAVVNFLSIEDFWQHFVVRVAVLDPHQSRPHAAWGNAQVVARDQRSTAYTGEVASAVDIHGGTDLAVSCWPPLNPAARLLTLTFGPDDWGVSLIAALDPGVPHQPPRHPAELELSAAAAQAVELAQRTALLAGVPVGPEHLLLSIVRKPVGDELRQTFETVNLQPPRVQAVVEAQPTESPWLAARELLSALHAARQSARRLGDVCVRPEHLLLGLLDDDGTRVDRVLCGLGITRQIVYGLLHAQLAARARTPPTQPGRVLRRVVAVGQTQATLPHTLTLMSIDDDYAAGFVVRGHLDSSLPRLDHATRQLSLTARDDTGRVYTCPVTATTGYGTGVGCSIDVAWTSTSELGPGAHVLELGAPDLGCTFTVPLEHATPVRHT